METRTSNKGGRPPKKIKRNRQLAVMCNPLEAHIIAARASRCNLTVSEYLREAGVNGEIKVRSLPREVLIAFNLLNNMSANLNQIVKRMHSTSYIQMNEIQELNITISDIQEFIRQLRIKLE